MTPPIDEDDNREVSERGDDGIKKLSTDNWLEGDDILNAFVRLDASGHRSALTKELLAERFLSIQLRTVAAGGDPDLVQNEREASCSMDFFSIRYTWLDSERSARTAEAAVARRCNDLGIPKKRRSFAARLEWLHENGHLTDREKFIWNTIRRDRNVTAHPSYQMVQPPTDLIRDLRVVAHCIDCLFDRSLDFDEFWTSRRMPS